MMKHNNSDYKKTFHYEQLLENKVLVATIAQPSSIIEYLENLIFDVIEKRNLNSKRIILFVNCLVTKQLLQSLLVCRKVIDNHKIIVNSTNQLSIVAVKNDFDTVIHEAAGGSINEEIFETDTCIFLYFNVLMNTSFSLMEQLRHHWKNKLWLCIEIETNKDTMQFLSFEDNELFDYLPERPETFEGFVNKSVLKGIENILDSLGDNDDSGIFSKQLSGEIFNGGKNEYVLEIGTSEYVDNNAEIDEYENEEIDEYENDKPFYVSIKLNNFGLELSMELQDYNMDGTKFLQYEMNFENEIYEEGSVADIEELIEEVVERINSQKVNIRLT